MKKFNVGLLAVALLVCISSLSNAGTVFFSGDGEKEAGATGVLNLLINTAPDNNTFVNGGINFSFKADTAGVIRFDSATANNEGGRWVPAGAKAEVSSDGQSVVIGLESVLTNGLTGLNGDTVLATINYTVLGAAGATTPISFVVAEEALYDGSINVPFGEDVTGNYTFAPGTISVGGDVIIPEPATLAMVATGMIGLVLRRRNG